MKTLQVLMKNRKQIESKPAPYVQLIEWRQQLCHHETIQLPTRNGLIRVDGRTVLTSMIDQDLFSTEEAASGMRFEPYTHYECNGNVYQYSLLSRSYERASTRGHIVLWVEDCLPEGEWKRRGKDSLLHARQISSE